MDRLCHPPSLTRCTTPIARSIRSMGPPFQASAPLSAPAMGLAGIIRSHIPPRHPGLSKKLGGGEKVVDRRLSG